MIFTLPPADKCQNVCGVYMMTLNNDWFYIGSSYNMGKRFIQWKNLLQKSRHLANTNIQYLLPGAFQISFSILEVIEDQRVLRKREHDHIATNFGNDYCLNIYWEGPDKSWRKILLREMAAGLPYTYIQVNEIEFKVRMYLKPG